MCDQDQDQPFMAPGFDANLHSCQVCNDTGISQETAGYCTACHMGKRIEQLDQFAEQLKGHGFTEAMRIVYRTTQRTEKAIAAADKALMMARIAKLENERKWISVNDARKPVAGQQILLFVKTLHLGEIDGQEAHAEGAEISMGEYAVAPLTMDEPYHFSCYTSPMSDNDWITHWMPLPASPVSKQG